MKQQTLLKTRQILNKYDIKANKRFGQNFLIDDQILSKIVEGANINNGDLIIEIGPGLGNLTQYIIERSGYTLLIEIDNNMINILTDRFPDKSKYMLINQDILKVNLDELITNLEQSINRKFNSIKVVANLPYYITSPIIFKLLQDSHRIDEIVVMVQKEVADRIVNTNSKKDYGILTLMVQYFADSNIILNVPSSSFIPRPNVESAVIRLTKTSHYHAKNEKVLFDLIHASFQNRRKKMINSLVNTHFMGMEKEQVINLIKSNGFSENIRAEELKLDDFIKIADSL